MLERFFRSNKKEETKKPVAEERKPIVLDFQEDPDMEMIVHKYINICRERHGYMHDGEIDKVKEADKKAKEMENQYGEKMRNYLKPYMETKVEWTDVPAKEHDRWQAAGTLEAVIVKEIRERLVSELKQSLPNEISLWPTLLEDIESGRKVPQSLMLIDFMDSIGFDMGLSAEERSRLREEFFLKDKWFKK